MEDEQHFAKMEIASAAPSAASMHEDEGGGGAGLRNLHGSPLSQSQQPMGNAHDNDDDDDDDDEFGKMLNALANEESSPMVAPLPLERLQDCGAFLDQIIRYIEAIEIPFQHVDLWVPSFATTDRVQGDVMRLCHAGHVTSKKLLLPKQQQQQQQQQQPSADRRVFDRLVEFGEFSKQFSFASGEDLPGRVYAKSRSHWIRKYDQADPTTYKRADGARMYGIKTAFAFALQTVAVDCIVVSFYSTYDVTEDLFLVTKCQKELSKLRPEPKWKLVVEMGPGVVPVAPPQPIPIHPAEVAAASAAAAAQRLPRGDSTVSVGSSFSQMSLTEDESHVMDNRMASLLSENMPLMEARTQLAIPNEWISHFVALRLVLLTPASQRTPEERQSIQVLPRSYNNYMKDSQRRSNQDLAYLLVQEWQHLLHLKREDSTTDESG